MAYKMGKWSEDPDRLGRAESARQRARQRFEARLAGKEYESIGEYMRKLRAGYPPPPNNEGE